MTPLQVADLSELEREALALLRLAPRILGLFAQDGSDALQAACSDVEASLIGKGVVERVPRLEPFVRLTPDGARLQADLFAEGGGE